MAEPKLVTNWCRPWVLIRRGGSEPGKRPATRMAFISKAVAENGKVILFRGWLCRDDFTGWTKSQREIGLDDVLAEWRGRPSAKEIARAKRLLKPTPRDPQLDAYREQRREIADYEARP